MINDSRLKPSRPEPLQILADDRERDAGVITALQRLDGVAVTVQRLALGDYQAADTLIVERKTFLDFTVSIKDGRLFTQARRLPGENNMECGSRCSRFAFSAQADLPLARREAIASRWKSGSAGYRTPNLDDLNSHI